MAPILEVTGVHDDGDNGRTIELDAEIIHQERGLTFWRWKVHVTLTRNERQVKYSINGSQQTLAFWVPSSNQSMRIVFHTCNGTAPSPSCHYPYKYIHKTLTCIVGFSQDVDPSHFNGPDPMWKDVLRKHKQRPWHVMLGGGDQIYCDGLAKKSRQFQKWLSINNLRRKFAMKCDENSELRNQMEEVFLEHYCQVRSQFILPRPARHKVDFDSGSIRDSSVMVYS